MTADDTHLLDTRRALLAAILPHVPFDGWSAKSLRAAAADAGVTPELTKLSFPGGIAELIAFWSGEADRAMVAAYEEADGDAMRFRERITAGRRARVTANGASALTFIANVRFVVWMPALCMRRSIARSLALSLLARASSSASLVASS